MPEISVIVPNYNHAKYLVQRIDSVLAQTYQDFEVIILDDCSTDESKSVIESYRNHPRVTHIEYNSENGGSVFKQWKKGFDLARGKYVWIAESDDWCESAFLEDLVALLDEGTALAFSQLHQIIGNQVAWTSKSDFLSVRMPGEEFVKSKMLRENGIANASACLFKRALVNGLDDRFLDFRFCGDWLFWVMIAAQGEVVISGKVLTYFRKHSEDVSGNAFRSGLLYSEYLKLTDQLAGKRIIDAEEQRQLMSRKYFQLLGDSRLNKEALSKTMALFKTRLGTRVFVVWFKYRILLLRNTIKAYL